jgi:hypothetical protein
MIGTKRPLPTYIRSPQGRIITRADLPPTHAKRWVASRKATVVAAVRGGLVSLEEACERYRLSREEFAAWERAFETGGLKALRAAQLQKKAH